MGEKVETMDEIEIKEIGNIGPGDIIQLGKDNPFSLLVLLFMVIFFALCAVGIIALVINVGLPF